MAKVKKYPIQNVAGNWVTVTQKQVDVFREISNGGSNKTIASKLGVTPDTISSRKNNTIQKIGATTTGHVVAMMFRSGLIK